MSIFSRLQNKLHGNLPRNLQSNLASSLPGFKDRFWYWHGYSGQKYIHSIYSLSDCPPLPGAVYVIVQKTEDGGRKALEVGRFGENWDYVEALIEDQRCGLVSIDEIHVHLLAGSDENADEVLTDLEGVIGHSSSFVGFREDPTPSIVACREKKPAPDYNPSWQAELFDTQSVDSAFANA